VDRTADSIVTLLLFGINIGMVLYVLWRDTLRPRLRPRPPEPALEVPSA
jgi:hypothetical protein